jgi:spore coat polysaccharide biosynthesis predicted glycosyltransferase SpsG
MKDGVNLVFLHNERNNFRVGNVASDEFEVLITEGGAEIFEIGPIIEDKKANKANIEILLGHEIANVGDNEAGTTGDSSTLRIIINEVRDFKSG